MSELENIIREYKRARQNRNDASSRDDHTALKMYNDELTYWYNKLNDLATIENIEIQIIKAMLK